MTTPPTITTRVASRARKLGAIVHDREDWGSVHSGVYAERRRVKPARQPADTVVQHITVTFDSGVLIGHFFTDCRTVERIGFERFGSGMSYNWLVDMTTGHIGVGQPLDAKGTHTVNDRDVPGFSHDQNLVARAIAVLGVPGTRLSRSAKTAIVRLLAAMVLERAITPGFDYLPHSHFASKDCPCDATRKSMASIRRRVDRTVKRANKKGSR